MEYKKLFISAPNRSVFEAALENDIVDSNAVGFIEETSEIWALGKYYPCPYTAEEILEKINDSYLILSLGTTNGITSYQLIDSNNLACGDPLIIPEKFAGIGDVINISKLANDNFLTTDNAFRWLANHYSEYNITPHIGLIAIFREYYSGLLHLYIYHGGSNLNNIDLANASHWRLLSRSNFFTDTNTSITNLLNKLNSIGISKNIRTNDIQYTLSLDGSPKGTIEVPNDTSIKDVLLADLNATINESGELIPGDPAGSTALCIVYILQDKTYKLVKLDYSSFLLEAEFGDGTLVENHVVSVKVDPTSDDYLSVGPEGVKVSGVKTDIDNLQNDITDINQTLPKSYGTGMCLEPGSLKLFVLIDEKSIQLDKNKELSVQVGSSLKVEPITGLDLNIKGSDPNFDELRSKLICTGVDGGICGVNLDSNVFRYGTMSMGVSISTALTLNLSTLFNFSNDVISLKTGTGLLHGGDGAICIANVPHPDYFIKMPTGNGESYFYNDYAGGLKNIDGLISLNVSNRYSTEFSPNRPFKLLSINSDYDTLYNVGIGTGLVLDSTNNLYMKLNDLKGLTVINGLEVKLGTGLGFSSGGSIGIKLGSGLQQMNPYGVIVRTRYPLEVDTNEDKDSNKGIMLRYDAKSLSLNENQGLQVRLLSDGGLTLGTEGGLKVNLGKGLAIGTLGVDQGRIIPYLGDGLETSGFGMILLKLSPSGGLAASDYNGLYIRVGDGLGTNINNTIDVITTDPLTISDRSVALKYDSFTLDIDPYEGSLLTKLATNGGLNIGNEGGISVSCGTGISIYDNKVSVKLGTGLMRDKDNNINVDVAYDNAGGLMVNNGGELELNIRDPEFSDYNYYLAAVSDSSYPIKRINPGGHIALNQGKLDLKFTNNPTYIGTIVAEAGYDDYGNFLGLAHLGIGSTLKATNLNGYMYLNVDLDLLGYNNSWKTIN